MFCYVCGHFTPKSHRQGALSEEFKKLYEAYFNQIVIENENWVPNIVCKTCYNDLFFWMQKKRDRMPFGIQMIWCNPGEHSESNCYVCANFKFGMNAKYLKNKKYIGVPSASIPLPHSENVPVPKFPSPDILSTCTLATNFTEATTESDYSLFEPGPSNIQATKSPELINQDELDVLVATCGLSQRTSEIIASFLKKKNLLAPGTKITAYRKRQTGFQSLFTVNDEKTFAYSRREMLIALVYRRVFVRLTRVFASRQRVQLFCMADVRKILSPSIREYPHCDHSEVVRNSRVTVPRVNADYSF